MGLGGDERREALATAEELKARMNGDRRHQAGDARRPTSRPPRPQPVADKSRPATSKTADKDDKPAAEKRAEDNRVQTERASRGKHRKAATAAGVYVVRRGDTLSAIARAKDVPGGWQNLYRMNKETIGSNPGLIHPGQRLHLG